MKNMKFMSTLSFWQITDGFPPGERRVDKEPTHM